MIPSLRSALALLVLLSACGASGESLARRSTYDLDCPHDQLHVADLGDGTRLVTGCGRQGTYLEACDRETFGGRRCRWVLNGTRTVEAEAEGAPALPASAPLEGQGGATLLPADRERVLATLTPLRPRVLACIHHDPVDPPVAITLTIDAHGLLTNMLAGEATDDALRCLATPLTGARVAGLDHALVVVWNVEVEPTVDATAAARPRLHDLLASHASDIVACVGHSPVGVHARWDAAGHVSLGLQGDLAGRPEEQCVSAAVGDATIDTGGHAGELVDVVRSP